MHDKCDSSAKGPVKSEDTVIAETATEFRVERITRENVREFAAGLSEMDLRVRGRKLGADFWPWLYFGNPAGAGTAVVALEGRRVVGKLGRVPVWMTADGERLTAELGEGLTLLPESRTWAHFRALGEAEPWLNLSRRQLSLSALPRLTYRNCMLRWGTRCSGGCPYSRES